jgi:hypothetical protein
MRLSTILANAVLTASRHDPEYQRARTGVPALAPHVSTRHLCEALSSKSRRSLEQFQPVVLAILREHQRFKHPLWQALLLIAFRPMLMSLRGRMTGGEGSERNELLLIAFLEAIARVPVKDDRAAVFIAVRRATARAAFAAVRAEQVEEVETCSFDEDSPECAPPVHGDAQPFVSCLAHEMVDVLAQRLGGEDAVRVLVGVETVSEQFERLGGRVSYRCVERRRDRALLHVRDKLSQERESA